jgi:Zn-dependent protease
MSIGRPPRALTVARVRAIEITLDWRWAPILLLATWLLGRNVLPARFPSWEITTTWLTAGAFVVAGEAALLLHELAHALVARRDGQRVTRIVFHGFRAVTHVDGERSVREPSHETLTALAGPAMNLGLAACGALVRVALTTSGPLDAFLLMLVVGNAAAAALSLVPVGGSDGTRALNALRRRPGSERQVPG